ncbi:MAG: response regulator transcription factor [Candidatus Acidiferrales bacterium]|jgi:DNA-binding NarL/FixJ family response regulator
MPASPPSGQAGRDNSKLDRQVDGKTRIFIAAPNRLVRETLARMLRKYSSLDVAGSSSQIPVPAEEIAASQAEILLLAAGGALGLDPEFVRLTQEAAGEAKIILLGMGGDEESFFRSIKAGVAGYLSRDASAQEVIAGVLAVREGGAVCSGRLCRALFEYVARDTVAFPSASMQRSLGLTRREQQIVVQVAQGLTNKEIANHFCLAEQTIKNHLYRMMQKTGVSDRLSIVELCRTQGFVM